MRIKYRQQVSQYLRILGFKVQTSPSYLSFNNYHLLFDDVESCVSIRNPYFHTHVVTVPYSTPAKLLEKLRLYFQVTTRTLRPDLCSLVRIPLLELTSTEIQAAKDQKKAIKKKPKHFVTNYNDKLPKIYG